MRGFLVAGALTLVSASTAYAQSCSSFVGQSISPKTIEQALGGLGDVSPKGEFETTAQYEARTQARSSGPLIISKKVEDPKYFSYDADAQVLKVETYAFHNTNMDWWGAFYAAKPVGIEASTLGNRAVVISQTERVTGSYKAQNSYGASATVAKIDKIVFGIFESEEGSYDGIFQNARSGRLDALPMDIPTAQRLKPTLKIAFVVEPKAPFRVRGSHSIGETTISNPTDVTEKFDILIADLQCGLLTDGSNVVLAAYPIK